MTPATITLLGVIAAFCAGFVVCLIIGRIDRKSANDHIAELRTKLNKSHADLNVSKAETEDAKSSAAEKLASKSDSLKVAIEDKNKFEKALIMERMESNKAQEKFETDLAIAENKINAKHGKAAEASAARIKSLEEELEHVTKLNSKMPRSTAGQLSELKTLQARWDNTTPHWKKTIKRKTANAAKNAKK